tara:strand:- start:130 stop:357 length:228 start_codon:yes stop_codon:yes gene_type:complete
MRTPEPGKASRITGPSAARQENVLLVESARLAHASPVLRARKKIKPAPQSGTDADVSRFSFSDQYYFRKLKKVGL